MAFATLYHAFAIGELECWDPWSAQALQRCAPASAQVMQVRVTEINQ